MKSKFTYSLFIICFIGVCFISFNSTLKLLKHSITVVLTEADFDDLEEDETERNEVEDNAKLISEKSNLSFLHIIQKHTYQNSVDARSISMFRFIQSPPPKI